MEPPAPAGAEIEFLALLPDYSHEDGTPLAVPDVYTIRRFLTARKNKAKPAVEMYQAGAC